MNGVRRFVCRYWAAIVVLCVYLITVTACRRDVFWAPDEGAKYLQIRAVQWELKPRLRVLYAGESLDPEHIFYPHGYPTAHVYPQTVLGCGVYANWRLGFTALTWPFYRLLGLWGLYLLPVLGGVATSALAGRIAERITPGVASLVTLIVGLATPVYFYSVLLWEHTLGTALALSALLCLMDLGRPEMPLRLLGIGLALVFASALRLELVVFAIVALAVTGVVALMCGRPLHSQAVLSYTPAGRRRLLRCLLALVVVGAVALLTVNAWPFSRLLEGYCPIEPRGIDTTVGRAVDAALMRPRSGSGEGAFASLLAGLPQADPPVALSILISMGAILTFAAGHRARPKGQSQAWMIVGMSLLLAGFLPVLATHERYRFVHSLLVSAPVVALLGHYISFARRAARFETSLFGGVAVLYLALGVCAAFARTDPIAPENPEWGMRYLLTAQPLLVVAAVVSLAPYRHSLARARAWMLPAVDDTSDVTWGIGASARRELAVATLSALVMLCGFALTVRGVGELVRTKRDLAAYQAALATRGGPVVTDLFWLPAALAPYYVSHEVYVTQGRDDLATWVHKIGGQRPDFVYVTAEPELPANALPLLIEREQTFVNGMWFFDVTVRALH